MVPEAIARRRLGICQLPSGRPCHSPRLTWSAAPAGYYVHVRKATISLSRRYGARSPWSGALAAEIRARRLAQGFTQAELGNPLSGSYVSAVEAGRVVPSLPALLLMLERLGVSAPIFFEALNCRLRSL
jgi:hypothetical protein